MNDPLYGWLSVVPPILAITLAIITRQVVVSLLAGVWVGWLIVASGNPLQGTVETINALVAVFAEGWQTKVIIFTMLMGSLLILMQRSGGVEGFVNWVGRWKWANTRRGAQMMAWVIGCGVFIESTITCLVVGTVSRPLFDKLKISREKLAYICDSTSAPVCMMLPFNGWGAMIIGLLAVQAAAGNLGDKGPLGVFLPAMALNFYAIISLLLVLITCLFDFHIGPMKRAEKRAREEGKLLRDGAVPVVDESIISMPTKTNVTPRKRNMILPLASMVLMVMAGIAITGFNGVKAENITNPTFMDYLNQASGSTAVLWGILFAVVVAIVMMLLQRIFTMHETMDLILKGAGGLVPLAAIMVFAFAIGATCNKLGTGPWVASIAQPYLTPVLIAPIVFIVASLIAFSTGTSWGTFAIMMPLAIPLAASYNLEGTAVSIPLVVSAVLGGGVFGDHCSPISDTSIVSSMASCSDHIDHVRTQMPYALLAGGLTIVLYLVIGML
ncbi:MAG: Na+/H+ antiporter NhaC family protein [Verrucomicrobia bacterium]|nr:Na+/H+ antiporter NhaC family protein [Verrucomicrobiota bacterium]